MNYENIVKRKPGFKELEKYPKETSCIVELKGGKIYDGTFEKLTLAEDFMDDILTLKVRGKLVNVTARDCEQPLIWHFIT